MEKRYRAVHRTALLLCAICIARQGADASAEVFVPDKETEAAMVAEFGMEKVVVEGGGSVVLFDGVYEPPPYTIERRGVHVYVNNHSVYKLQFEWPWDISDPGDPPGNKHLFESHVYDKWGREYWDRKISAMMHQYEPQVAAVKIFDALQKASAASGGAWEAVGYSADAGSVRVTIRSRENQGSKLESLNILKPDISAETVLYEAVGTMCMWEESLASNRGVAFVFSQDSPRSQPISYWLEPTDDSTAAAIEILSSSESDTSKKETLSELISGMHMSGFPVEKIVAGFHMTDQLKAALTRMYDLADAKQAGLLPPEVTSYRESVAARAKARREAAEARYMEYSRARREREKNLDSSYVKGP